MAGHLESLKLDLESQKNDFQKTLNFADLSPFKATKSLELQESLSEKVSISKQHLQGDLNKELLKMIH